MAMKTTGSTWKFVHLYFEFFLDSSKTKSEEILKESKYSI